MRRSSRIRPRVFGVKSNKSDADHPIFQVDKLGLEKAEKVEKAKEHFVRGAKPPSHFANMVPEYASMRTG